MPGAPTKFTGKPPVPLKRQKYGVALIWDDIGGCGVDLDLQAVIVAESGYIVDAVYYNNTVAMGGAVGHLGDEVSGDAEGYDEMVWMKLDQLPKQIKLILFVVCAYDGRLCDAANGQIVIVQEYFGNRFKELKMERSTADADIVCMFKRIDGTAWEFHEIQEPAAQGAHFLDILEPNIGDLIRREIPQAPAVQKVSFKMTKGSVSDLPVKDAVRRLFVGIGGCLPVTAHANTEVDIDVSAVFYNSSGRRLGAVDPNHQRMYGVQHSGDGLARPGSQGDEAITMDLDQMSSKVSQVFLCLHVNNGTFKLLDTAYTRISDNFCNELVNFKMKCGSSKKGLIMARILRAPSKRWSVEALENYFDTFDEAQTIMNGLVVGQEKRFDRQGSKESQSSTGNPANVSGKKTAANATKMKSQSKDGLKSARKNKRKPTFVGSASTILVEPTESTAGDEAAGIPSASTSSITFRAGTLRIRQEKENTETKPEIQEDTKATAGLASEVSTKVPVNNGEIEADSVPFTGHEESEAAAQSSRFQACSSWFCSKARGC